MPRKKEKQSEIINLANDFSKETFLYWYKSMVLMRKFEEMAGKLYGQQKLEDFVIST